MNHNLSTLILSHTQTSHKMYALIALLKSVVKFYENIVNLL